MTEQEKGTTDPVLRTSLASKLARIMGELESVPKRGRNDFHGYDYATEADIAAAVRSKLAAAGVAVCITTNGEPTLQGDLMLVPLTISLVDGETGELWGGNFYGAAQDKGDKALWKAMTGAMKYFLLKTFLISTGDDPEADVSTDERAAARTEPRQATDGGPPARTQAGITAGCPKCGGPILESKINAGQKYCKRRKECGWESEKPAAVDAPVPF